MIKNDDKIIFIYCGTHDEFNNYYEDFFSSIKKINNDKIFKLVLLNSDKNNKDEQKYIKINDTIYIINLINMSIDNVDLRHYNLLDKDIFFNTLC